MSLKTWAGVCQDDRAHGQGPGRESVQVRTVRVEPFDVRSCRHPRLSELPHERAVRIADQEAPADHQVEVGNLSWQSDDGQRPTVGPHVQVVERGVEFAATDDHHVGTVGLAVRPVPQGEVQVGEKEYHVRGTLAEWTGAAPGLPPPDLPPPDLPPGRGGRTTRDQLNTSTL